MPGREALAESYARASGRYLGKLEFYLALGYLKIAVIAEGIHARYGAGKTVGNGFETVGTAVPGLAAAGLRIYEPHERLSGDVDAVKYLGHVGLIAADPDCRSPRRNRSTRRHAVRPL